eukprot:UN18882
MTTPVIDSGVTQVNKSEPTPLQNQFEMKWLFMPQNRGTLKTLIEFTLLMIFLPIIGYKLSYKLSVTYLNKTWQHYLPAIIAVVCVKIVTTLFLIKAFTEEDSDDEDEGEESKKEK